MRARTACALVAALGIVTADRLTAEPQSPPETRRIFVTALDNRGTPVTDLTAAEFVVKEDGRERPIVSAAPATAPLQIALMIDDSGLGLQAMREGAAAFVRHVQGVAEMAVITTGGRNIVLSDFTTDTDQLIATVNRIYARNLTGAFLTDGFLEVARVFGQREAQRPVIVSVGVEGEDFSAARPADVLAALLRTGTQLYMVRIGRPVLGQSNPAAANRGESLADEQTRFNAILGQAPPRSGGRIEQLTSDVGIPVRMQAIARELTSQYEVTYTTDKPDGVELRLEVSSPRRGVRLRAPQRVGQPRQ